MKDEALKLALEALEQLQGGCTDSDDGTVEAITVWCPEVIDAIKQALAAPVQEPVGRVCFEGDEVVWTDEPPESGTLLYTTPPTSPVQEPRKISDFPELQAAVRKGLADGSLIIQGASPVQPVVRWDSDGWGDLLVDSLPDGTLLYTTPPTDEIQRLAALVRAQQITIEKLEALLKEKNSD
jgi:hypothetical protein